MVGWTVFYFTDIVNLGRAIKAMLGINGQPFVGDNFIYLFSENILLIVAATIACIPIAGWIREKYFRNDSLTPAKGVLMAAYSCALLMLTTISLAGSGFNPFLYFRF